MSEFGPEEQQEDEKKPSSEELAQACKEVLSEEDCQEFHSMDIEDALGYAFTLLIENGIDDPEQFLKDKGILK